MFFPIKLATVNGIGDLQTGDYIPVCSTYENHEIARRVLFFEYSLVGDTSPSACDLVIIEPKGEVLMRDFVRLPDRSWRDSNGQRSDNLAEMLPSEIFEYKLVTRITMDAQPVGK
jgi:hypothetical protein